MGKPPGYWAEYERKRREDPAYREKKKSAKAAYERRREERGLLPAFLLKRYGITQEEYDALREAQGGKCAACFRECPTRSRLSVDHDHDTGKVRGLLCLTCNTALGHARDDVRILRALIDYLEVNQPTNQPTSARSKRKKEQSDASLREAGW